MAGEFDLGNTLNLDILLSDPDTGAAVTTGDLVCHVTTPDGGGPVNVSPVTQVTAGGPATPARYRARYASTMAGEHWFQYTSVALGLQVEGAFVVRASRVS